MKSPRVRIVRVLLTTEQREKIRLQSGEDVTEAIFAAPVCHDKPLEDELVGQAAQQLGEALWSGNDFFFRSIDGAPEAKKSFEQHIEHALDSKWPMLTILR